MNRGLVGLPGEEDAVLLFSTVCLGLDEAELAVDGLEVRIDLDLLGRADLYLEGGVG